MEDEPTQMVNAFAYGGALRAVVRTKAGALAVTDERLVVVDGQRLALDMPINGVRRAELVIERGRPTILIVVAEEMRFGVQSLHIADDVIPNAAKVLALIASRFSTPRLS